MGGPIATKAGKSYSQMLDGAGSDLKALYIMGANPASERPAWAAKLDALDFLVVQDLFLTETAQLADVVLPAVSWAEEDGTFTNLERRAQRAPKAVRSPDSKAASDWMILDHLAAAWRPVALCKCARRHRRDRQGHPRLPRPDLGRAGRPGRRMPPQSHASPTMQPVTQETISTDAFTA